MLICTINHNIFNLGKYEILFMKFLMKTFRKTIYSQKKERLLAKSIIFVVRIQYKIKI